MILGRLREAVRRILTIFLRTAVICLTIQHGQLTGENLVLNLRRSFGDNLAVGVDRGAGAAGDVDVGRTAVHHLRMKNVCLAEQPHQNGEYRQFRHLWCKNKIE